MAESTSEKNFGENNYEDKFEFPLWTLIKQRAEEKDTSYAAVLDECLAEYGRTIRYGDKEFEDAAINRWLKERDELLERIKKK